MVPYRVIAEVVLGKALPHGAVVHHVDGSHRNNRKDNLVICQDAAYHNLLHVRKRALEACGNPNWRVCSRCKEYDSQVNLIAQDNGWYCHGPKLTCKQAKISKVLAKLQLNKLTIEEARKQINSIIYKKSR